jgi:hypothetical protein
MPSLRPPRRRLGLAAASLAQHCLFQTRGRRRERRKVRFQVFMEARHFPMLRGARGALGHVRLQRTRLQHGQRLI